MQGDVPNRHSLESPIDSDTVLAPITEKAVRNPTTRHEETTELAELILSIGTAITHLLSLTDLARRRVPENKRPRKGPRHIEVNAEHEIEQMSRAFPILEKHPWLAQKLGIFVFRCQHRVKGYKTMSAADYLSLKQKEDSPAVPDDTPTLNNNYGNPPPISPSSRLHEELDNPSAYSSFLYVPRQHNLWNTFRQCPCCRTLRYNLTTIEEWEYAFIRPS